MDYEGSWFYEEDPKDGRLVHVPFEGQLVSIVVLDLQKKNQRRTQAREEQEQEVHT